MPAVYDLANRGLLPPGFALVGFARRDWADQDFAQGRLRRRQGSTRAPRSDEEVWNQLAEGIRFVQGEFDDDDGVRPAAARRSTSSTRERGTMGNHAFYLSIPPKAFPLVCRAAGPLRPGRRQDGDQWRRVVIEKPFGHDLKTRARARTTIVESVFPPDSVFRIDHYLGKETVQNILALRFANQLFEPIWNAQLRRPRADHHGRGHRRRRPGRLLRRHRRRPRRHPEPPAAAAGPHRDGGADLVRRRRTCAPRRRRCSPPSGCPRTWPRPPRAASTPAAGRAARRSCGFLEEDGMTRRLHDRDLRRDQARASTPGAGRACRSTCAPASAWAAGSPRSPSSSSARRTCLFARSQTEELGQNALVIRVQPDEGVTIRFGSKVPGAGMEVRDVTMDFGYGHAFTEASPEAYERLILDVLLGDPPLFPRHEEVELSWKILDPIEEYWATPGPARAVRARHLGPGVRRRAAGPRRPHLEAAMIVDLPDTTTSARSSQGARRRCARRAARSPSAGC